MKSSNVIAFCVIIFLTFPVISEGMSLKSLGVELHCRCIKTESRRIGHHIEKVELIPASSHCEEPEIIATLKNTRQEVCLNPEAPWVKKLFRKSCQTKTIEVYEQGNNFKEPKSLSWPNDGVTKV